MGGRTAWTLPVGCPPFCCSCASWRCFSSPGQGHHSPILLGAPKENIPLAVAEAALTIAMEGISCDWLWWTLSALMCFFRHWIFLNVLLHVLHVCIVVALFVIMCLANKVHFIFIYINFVCLCNSAFIHIICVCFFSFSIAFAWFLLIFLCKILVFLRVTIHMLIFILYGSSCHRC